MKKTHLLLITTLFLNSCGSKEERLKAIQERDALQKELNDIKFGAAKLLSDAKGYITVGDIQNAKDKLKELILRHFDKPEIVEGKILVAQIEEKELWDYAFNSQDLEATNNYIQKYPNGTFVKEAKHNIEKLKVLYVQRAYENAQREDKLFTWMQFAKDYPEHPKAKSIKKNLDKMSPDEIKDMISLENARIFYGEQSQSIDYSGGNDPNFHQSKDFGKTMPTTSPTKEKSFLGKRE